MIDNPPLVSVVMPVYNRAFSIKKAIKSVINQTYPNWELILVDDCSTDNSLEIIRTYITKYDNISLIILEENSGPAVARNKGIIAANGEFISLLDSDDYYEHNFIEESIKILRFSPKHIGFSWTGLRNFRQDYSSEGIWKPIRKRNTYETFLYSLKIGTNSGLTFKKDVFDVCGLFDSSLPAAEDTEFFLRISRFYDYVIIPKILMNIQKDNADRLSKNFKKVALAYNNFLPLHYDRINEDETLQFKYYYKMMWLNYQLGEKNRAREFFRKIPNSNKAGIKSFITYLIYELFPLSFASKIHQKISSI